MTNEFEREHQIVGELKMHEAFWRLILEGNKKEETRPKTKKMVEGWYKIRPIHSSTPLGYIYLYKVPRLKPNDYFSKRFVRETYKEKGIPTQTWKIKEKAYG